MGKTVVGGGGVGRVWCWCAARQLRRKELSKVVPVLGLDGGEGDEDKGVLCTGRTDNSLLFK